MTKWKSNIPITPPHFKLLILNVLQILRRKNKGNDVYARTAIASFLLCLIIVIGGCTDEIIGVDNNGEFEKGPLVEAYLSLSVDNYTISSAGTRAAEPSETPEIATDAEKRIDNIWVFQYNAATGQQIIKPAYYEITDQQQLDNLKVLLKEDIESIICIVANTFDSGWVKGDRFATYNQLKNEALSNPEPIRFDEFQPIPMEGEKSGVTVHENEIVEVEVTRMYAKLKISFGELAQGTMRPVSIEINNIPDYCRVSTLGKQDESAATYSVDIDWITRSFYTDKDFNEDNEDRPEYVIYVPENIQGETTNGGEQSKDTDAPANALVLKILMMYKAPGSDTEESRYYTVYPGGNTYNNFNIRRNSVYRIIVNIRSANEAHTPSSNCFVIEPGRGISFEPYYRTETGGIDGSDSDDLFRFENYLNPTDTSGEKVIDNVQILWQTKDAIGDNTNFDKVWFEENGSDPLHSKVYVKANKEGNALIGAFNTKDELLWSWHIWITGNDPANVGNAIVYTTYDWESDIYEGGKKVKNGQVKTDKRIPGYAIMPCNLGAFANEPTDPKTPSDDYIKTFGMLYQWGRKDPFPPGLSSSTSYPSHTIFRQNYSEVLTGTHCDYTNEKKIIKTGNSGVPNPESTRFKPIVSFYSVLGSDFRTQSESIKYTISNPCVFICGTKSINESAINPQDMSNYVRQSSNYFAQGDWMGNGTEGHNNKLWGGLDPIINDHTRMKSYKTPTPDRYILDNYGDKKTIFDPCPAGWRVPPGDLWLGFSKTGLNPGGAENVNYDPVRSSRYGYYMYMRKSRWDQNAEGTVDLGPTLFFPTQGCRTGDGVFWRTGTCGNYHNATTDINNVVNILHIHDGGKNFNIFETFYEKILKSVAGPIRCVRDRK